MSNAAAVTSKTFDDEVLQSPVPVLVDFWATWCGPCKMIAADIDAIAQDYAGKLKVVKLDVDAESDVAMKYRVMSIPTLIVFKDGKEADRLLGAVPKKAIVAKLERVLGA